jgi:predicted Na+-dependent transporter
VAIVEALCLREAKQESATRFQTGWRRVRSGAMKLLVIATIYLLMFALGMSLSLRELLRRWKAQSALNWIRLLLVTFIIPPALALLVSHIFRLTGPETAGLFMIGCAPGAPLLMLNVSRKGFDMHMAASYQLWAALMALIMIPTLTAVAGAIYDRNVWVPPSALLPQIIMRQFLPIACGMLLAALLPKLSERLEPVALKVGNLMLLVCFICLLYLLGKAVLQTTPLVPVAALSLAVGSMAAVHVIRLGDVSIRRTFALCNANRHAGLALFLTANFLRLQKSIPAVACYALIAPVVMIVYAKFFPAVRTEPASV